MRLAASLPKNLNEKPSETEGKAHALTNPSADDRVGASRQVRLDDDTGAGSHKIFPQHLNSDVAEQEICSTVAAVKEATFLTLKTSLNGGTAASAGVLEVLDDWQGDTYPKPDLDKIHGRLKAAEAHATGAKP